MIINQAWGNCQFKDLEDTQWEGLGDQLDMGESRRL